jgi:hypothetical protein
LGGVVTDLDSFHTVQELVVPVSEEVVVDGVLRGEVRIERLGLHIHGTGERPEGQTVKAVSPHHLPRGVEDLALRGFVANMTAVATDGIGWSRRSHPLILHESGAIILTMFGQPTAKRNTERRCNGNSND